MDFKEEFRNLDKKSLLCLGAIILITVIVFVGLLYFLSKDQQITVQKIPDNRIKNILKTLGTSTPGEEGREVSEKELKDLGGPDKNAGDINEDVLKTLGTIPE